jgi:CDP-diacylglycerol--serine O-phosphatidyltransferase
MAKIYSLLLMALVGLLSLLMVSTLRFSSFKTVGTRSRSMRTIILAVGVGMLIFLYSRHVLLVLVVSYILHGLLSRVVGVFRKRPELSEAKIEAEQM